MNSQADATVRVAVVDDVAGDDGRRDRVVDVLTADASRSVTDLTAVDEVREAVRAGDLDCVVCGDPTTYDAVRAVDSTVPVVVVAASVERETLDRVVGDAHADHLAPDDLLATALPVRLQGLLDEAQSETAWQLAGFSDDAVVEFDLETTRLVDANETFFDAWGWDRDRLDDTTLTDLRETDITVELRGRGRGAAGEELLEWLSDDDPVTSLVDNALGGLYELREWHCHDGEGRAFKTTVRVVADEGDRHGYLVATVPDDVAPVGPSDHDEASMLRSLLDHIPMSVYFKDTLSRHVLVSEDVAEPFIETPSGKILHSPEDVLGKTDFDLYPEAGAVESFEEDARVIRSGEPVLDRLERVQPPHGRPLFFQTTKAPWYGEDGRVQGIVGVTVDITDQKRRERELDRQNERLEEFASIVSHDLRNPLNVAQGRLDIYRRTGDESELDTVAEMHERIADLIDEVLAFAREGSRIEDPEWIDGESRAEEAWNAVETAQATLEQDWAYAVRADPRRLVRLFENLFRNAIEHAGTDVTVEVGTLDDEPGFYVQDDGLGVPEDVRDTLFERGISTESDGTGYGLAIVKEIAEAHGWAITATESYAGGARFEVTGVPRGSDN